MKSVALKPLGKVLEEAGLVSNAQVRAALDIQSKYGQFKFGTILVTLGILKHKTIDFFVDQFPKYLEQPKNQPLGWYLEQAALIDSRQIGIILQEQKRTGKLFGELTVEKGWLKKRTLNFFLKHLSANKTKTHLTPTSSQEAVKSSNSKTKAAQCASNYSLLKEVFFWTGGHPLLTQHVCQIISDSEEFIPAGVEVIWVEKLVHDYVINNWKNKHLGGFFKTVENYILNNKVCSPRDLLKLYLKVLQQETSPIDNSKEEQELIRLGLVVAKENQLTVSNRIYQSIFNSEWVEKQLMIIAKRSQDIFRKNKGILSRKLLASAAIKLQNEPFTQVAALTIVLGLLLTSPIVIFFNNFYFKLSQTQNSIASEISEISKIQTSTITISQESSTLKLCTDLIPSDSATREEWRISLEQQRQQSQENFSSDCRNSLDKLTILNAIRLGKENRVLDGINHLCKINTTSESFNQAKFWLSRWHSSPSWGEHTEYYLNSIEGCPVAEKL